MTDVMAIEAPAVEADTHARTITGMVLPWNKPGKTTAGALSFTPGSVSLPNDLRRVKLFRDHRGTRDHAPAGYATAYESRPDGLYMTFVVGSTADGESALTDAREGIRDAFSVEVNGLKREGTTVTASLLSAVALVAVPAFADARVAEVHAAETTDDQDEPAEDDSAGGRGQPRDEAGRGLPESTDTDDQDDDDTAADSDNSEGNTDMTDTANASRPAVVPAGLQTGDAARAELTLSAAADAVLAVQTGAPSSDEAHAALANITGSSMVDAAPPQWLGELFSGNAYTRRIVPLLGSRPLTSWRIQGFRWTQKPLVDKYVGDKAEIPTNEVAIEPYDEEAVRWAGGHDLDRKFYDFRDTGIIQAYWRAMSESYALVTDANAADFVIANAAAKGTAADLFAAMATADAALQDTLNTTSGASFYLGNPADKLALLGMSQLEVPAYLSFFNIDPRQVVWSNKVPAGTLVAGEKAAITHYELPGSPLRVEAEHLSHGGKDAALFGYTALTLDNPDGLVKVTFGAPAAPIGE